MLRALVPYLAYAYVTLVGLTTRLRTLGEDHRQRLRRADRRFIYAFWHQRQVYFTWTHRDEKAAVLVSRSRDGEMIAETMRLSRMRACRGSSSRGAAVAARSLIEAAESGWDLALTPDGPKGPARSVKPGVIFLAQKLGIPILPLTNALSSKLTISRAWDRFQVPLPFGKAVVIYAEPISVGPEDDPEAKAEELRLTLERITEQAEREVGR